jgi:hypothetical protein
MNLVIPGRGHRPRAWNPRTRTREINGLSLCAWVPGPALTGRPGMTLGFFSSLLAHPGFQGFTRTYTPAEPGACVMACRMRGELGEECCCCSFHSGLSGTAVPANS